MKMLTARIETIRSRAYSEFSNYTVAALLGHQMMVSHNTDFSRRYYVNLAERTCNCPACEKEGYCKHIAIVQIWNKREEFHRNREPQTAYEAWLYRFTKALKA